MKKHFYLVIALLGYSLHVSGQVATVSRDSSSIFLASGIEIGSAKVRPTKGVYLTRSELRTIVTHVNFLSNMLAVSKQRIQLLEKSDSLSQTSIALLETKHSIERRRTEQFKAALQQLEAVAAAYDDRLKSCSDDLMVAAKESRKVKRKSFTRGLAVGIGTGLIVLTTSLLLD